MPTKRNYRKEYDNYQGKPKQKKRRASRNTARGKLGLKGKRYIINFYLEIYNKY